jgi:hypothetical protein
VRLARRVGWVDWRNGSTAQDAIGQATLLPARKPPAWLLQAASNAEQQILAATAATDGT